MTGQDTESYEWIGYHGRFILLDEYDPDLPGYIGKQSGLGYGVTTDAALLDMLSRIVANAVTVWHLWAQSALPDDPDIKLLENVTAFGLTIPPYRRVERPRVTAELQRAGIDLAELPDPTVWDYRSQRGQILRHVNTSSEYWTDGMNLRQYVAALTLARPSKAPPTTAPPTAPAAATYGLWAPPSPHLLMVPGILPAPSMVGTFTPWPRG